MPISSDAIGLGRITAGQTSTSVRVGRIVSANAWRRRHLVCHCLQEPHRDMELLAQGLDRWGEDPRSMLPVRRRRRGFDRRPCHGPEHDGRVPAAAFSNSVLHVLTTSSECDGVIDQLVQLGPG